MDTIITIGRQNGCGGLEVGRSLAARLGCGFYDKELLSLAAKEIGFDPALFERADERRGFTHFFKTLEEGFSTGFAGDNMLSDSRLFQAQSDAIRALASRGPCVLVGRCADYVLRDHPGLVSVFLSASDEWRLSKAALPKEADPEKALAEIRGRDKRRAAYYNHYSSKLWGDAASYNICLDITGLDPEIVTDIILRYAKAKSGGKQG